MARTIVVVPCYNEAQRLDPNRFEQFLRSSSAVDFLFVDDGSSDKTLGLLEQLQCQHPLRCSVLALAHNSGKAEAVRQGLLRAFEVGPEYAGFWDADLATPLEEAVKFCDVLDRRPDIELVVGARIPLLGRAIRRRWLRATLGRLFARAASLIVGVKVYDTQCGAKLFRVTPSLRSAFARPFITNWVFDVELLARLLVARRDASLPCLSTAIYECPLDAWEDVAGSKVRAKDFFRAIVEMIRIYWTYLRPRALRLAGRIRGNRRSPHADVPASGPPVPAPHVTAGFDGRGHPPTPRRGIAESSTTVAN